MAKFERISGGRRDSSRGSSRGPSRGPSRDSGRGRSFGGPSRGRRDSSRESPRFGRDRGDVEMTKVICSACGSSCEVPFKPTSSKPVFCSECFSKNKSGSSSHKSSGRDFEIINEKLDKIMDALEIR
jgi:CxxC-x17-CxxC domain-containing protein